MDEPIRQEGFLVVQETSLNGWSAFHKTREAAEDAAKGMLRNNHPVLVIPIVRFTTKQINEWRTGRSDG